MSLCMVQFSGSSFFFGQSALGLVFGPKDPRLARLGMDCASFGEPFLNKGGGGLLQGP